MSSYDKYFFGVKKYGSSAFKRTINHVSTTSSYVSTLWDICARKSSNRVLFTQIRASTWLLASYIMWFCWWGCVEGAVVRCEDIWPYLSKNYSGDNECKKIFKHFLRGLFGFENEIFEIDSPESLVDAIDIKNWRAIEFLLGKNGKFDATFPLPYDEKQSSNWERG